MKKKQKIIELENLLFLSHEHNSGLVKSNVKLTNNLNAIELSNDNLRKESKLTKVKLNYFEAKLNVTIKELKQTQLDLKLAESALNYKEIRENDNALFMAKVLRNHNDR